MHIKIRPLALVSLGLFSAACGDPVKFGQDLEETRVIGVRMESEGGSAHARADEDLLIEILLAGSDGPTEASVAVTVCEIADSARGVPFCEGPTYGEEILSKSAKPRLSVRVPEDAPVERRVGVLGVACEKGEPTLADDPMEWSCSDEGVRPLRFSFDSVVAEDDEEKNPDLSSLVVRLDDERVPLEDVDLEPSCDSGVVTVEPGRVLDVLLDLGEGARQPEESLQISHFATSGRYQRQFTIKEPTESLEFTLEWSAPEEEGPVKHYVVVRDALGGVSWSTFSLCVSES